MVGQGLVDEISAHLMTDKEERSATLRKWSCASIYVGAASQHSEQFQWQSSSTLPNE